MNLGGWNEGPFGECRKVEARAGGERQVTSESVQLPPRKPADPAEAGRAAPATLPFQEPAWARGRAGRTGGRPCGPAARPQVRRGGAGRCSRRGGAGRGGVVPELLPGAAVHHAGRQGASHARPADRPGDPPSARRAARSREPP